MAPDGSGILLRGAAQGFGLGFGEPCLVDGAKEQVKVRHAVVSHVATMVVICTMKRSDRPRKMRMQ